MRGGTRTLAVIAALIVIGYITYSVVYPTISIRYRLTLDVDIDGVTHTGSGVVEIVYNFEPHPFNIDEFQIYPGHLHGSAITVDLGDRGLLLVVDVLPHPDPYAPKYTLGTRTLASLPIRANDFERPELVTEPQTIRNIKRNRQLIDVPREVLPMLIRFRTDAGPSSLNHLEEIDPANLHSSLGSGARVMRVTYQITDDPITPIPKIWPKWLAEFARMSYSSGCSLPATAFKGEWLDRPDPSKIDYAAEMREMMGSCRASSKSTK